MYQKPFLKWVGGKTQIIHQVLDKFPNEINNYHEIFIGGGSVLLALLSKQMRNEISIHGKIYAYDYNASLINIFKDIRDNKDIFYSELYTLFKKYDSIKEHKGTHTPNTLEEAEGAKESFYYWIRKQYNQSEECVKKSAMFMFMNKTCFRGLYRSGPNGFNVPYGNYKTTPGMLKKEELDYISRLLEKVEFIQADFRDSLKHVENGDFIYLDPPYAPETNNSFVSYNNTGFSQETHEELFDLIKTLPCKFLLSNSHVPLILEKFKDYNIESIKVRRSINSKKPNATSKEVLIF